MLTCYSLINNFFNLRLLLLLIFTGALVIKCNGYLFISPDDISCPLIETVSFESDIDIKCNNTYLIFNEINNNKKSNWVFADQSPYCRNKNNVEAFVNQCNITRINSKYLKVRLKSTERHEYACVYCRINYKPIAPIISVTQSDASGYISYTFNLSATRLKRNESFEILWAKRVNSLYGHSYNFWFARRCVARDVKVFQNAGHSVIFTVDDIAIERVEFIIRRCNGTCRTYQKCSEEDFNAEASSTDLQMPDSIEKISCNSDCLHGIFPPSSSPPPPPTSTIPLPTSTTANNFYKENNIQSSALQLSKEKQTIKLLILFSILGLLIVLAFIMLAYLILSRIKGLRSDNVYTKTSNVNLDENKGTIE